MPRPNRSLTVALVCLMLAACDSGNSPVSPTNLTSIDVQTLVTSLEAGGVQAVARPGLPPRSSGGPTITVTGNQNVVNGGTLNAAVVSSTPFQTLYVYIGSKTVGLVTESPGGVDGYYEVRLPSTQTATTALLAFAQTIPLPEFELLFAVADPSGAVGPFVGLSVRVTSVGTGDVQVTLSWDANADVDLHVVDPAGEEVFYAHRRSASGGELDLDSNAGCAIDGVRNENITWPVGQAPRGQYIVRVDYWSSCGVQQTNYTVRVNSAGNVQLFSGSFTGPGDQGGVGAGRPITTFQRSLGPTAAPSTAAAPLNGLDAGSDHRKTLVGPQR